MRKHYDVIVAGAGAAGLFTALHLDSSLQVLVLSKRDRMLSNSSLAQGGIAAVVDTRSDNTDLHLNDTFIAGSFKNNVESVKVLVNEGPGDVKELMAYGVDFDKKPDGEYDLTLEGGHCRNRIFHHKDNTGFAIVEALIKEAAGRENITILEDSVLCGLKKMPEGFALQVLRDGSFLTLTCGYCVLATGGIGRVYEYTTNSKIATGDGIMLAHALEARIKNLHLVQFHPTAFANKARECFLISESVRGEGAYLLNGKKERFMHKYDDRLELAPRDVVSHFIMEEAARLKDNRFYLDITHKDPDFVRGRFPMIHEKLLENGIDMTKDLIPVYPCQHYLMGGIDVDLNGETTIPDLFAAGECSHTGVHGSNRLASNSLLEAIVFGHRIAGEVSRRIAERGRPAESAYQFPEPAGAEPLPHGIRTEIRAIMQQCYFVMPDPKKIPQGFQRIRELKELIEKGNWLLNIDYVEARALATVAYLILQEIV